MLDDFPFLASLASSEHPKDRQTWIRVATDYVVSEAADPETSSKIVEAIASQLKAVERATQLEVARKLASSARSPIRLLLELVSTDSEVGAYLLEHAVAFTGQELEQAIALGGKRPLAVAKRRDLAPGLASLLAAQNDIGVLVALARNGSVRPEGTILHDLFERARQTAEEEGDHRLAEALLERKPAWPQCASLFLVARPDKRTEILLAAQRLQLGQTSSYPASIESASLDELEIAAVARQPDQFLARLAEALNCDRELARKIVGDPTGEPLAVALTALGAGNEVLARILISNDLMSGSTFQRIGALARLNGVLSQSAAAFIVKALRGATEANGRRGLPRSNPASSRSGDSWSASEIENATRRWASTR